MYMYVCMCVYLCMFTYVNFYVVHTTPCHIINLSHIFSLSYVICKSHLIIFEAELYHHVLVYFFFYFTFVKMKSNQHVSFPTFQSNCKVFKFYSFNTCHHFIGILEHQNHGIFHKIMFYNVLSPMNYVTIFLYTIFSKYHLHHYGGCITARTLCILCVVS